MMQKWQIVMEADLMGFGGDKGKSPMLTLCQTFANSVVLFLPPIFHCGAVKKDRHIIREVFYTRVNMGK